MLIEMKIFNVLFLEEISLPTLSYGIYILLFQIIFEQDIHHRNCYRYYETPCIF